VHSPAPVAVAILGFAAHILFSPWLQVYPRRCSVHEPRGAL